MFLVNLKHHQLIKSNNNHKSFALAIHSFVYMLFLLYFQVYSGLSGASKVYTCQVYRKFVVVDKKVHSCCLIEGKQFCRSQQNWTEQNFWYYKCLLFGLTQNEDKTKLVCVNKRPEEEEEEEEMWNWRQLTTRKQKYKDKD